MKKLLIIFFSLFFPLMSLAQWKARDPGLLGQYKRMVDDRWDYWRPDPTWHEIFGVPVWPKNAEGAFFWGVLNRKYWKGHDRRPFRADGPFTGHLLAARAHQELAEKEKDTVTVTMKKSLATDLSMEGGNLDVPYKLYFKDKFSRLLNKAYTAFKNIKQKYPEQWDRMMNEPKETTRQLWEYFEVTKDRIHTLHNSYMDRGSRMIAYFKILATLEKKVDFTVSYCNVNVREANLPSPEEVKLAGDDLYIPENDKETVRHILKTWDF